MKKIRLIVIRKFILIIIFAAIIISLISAISIKYCMNYGVFNNSINVDNNSTSPISNSKLAIVIDDFGQNRKGVKEMMTINRHLTFAVMPFLAFSNSDATLAYSKGYEVIVHLPMESNGGHSNWVGPKPILTSMSENDIKQVVKDSFNNIPFAVGANIHMGSKAGGDERVLSAVLDIVSEKGFYFVDSRSCKSPIAKRIADSKNVLCFDRNVFLDGKKDKSHIKNQLYKACEVSKQKGYAVAIGHVGTEGGIATANAISEMLPEFDKMNIKLVFVSELGK